MSSMGTSRTLQETPPAHCIVKIESFSLLAETKLRDYESGVFEAGGFKWKLRLFPNGDNKRGGKDHVSLYLTIAETEGLEPNWEAKVTFKMFVFDKKENKYLTIQEADGKVWQFNESQSEWGYPQLLSKRDLYTLSTGYLVDDLFTYGVEVCFVNDIAKIETLSRINNPEGAIFPWTITNFHDNDDNEILHSDEFVVADYKWQIALYPNGTGNSKGKDLSLYLKLADASSLPRGRKIYVQFKLLIKNQLGQENSTSQEDHWFSSEAGRCGIKAHTSLSDLMDSAKGFVVDDTIIVEAEIVSMSMIKEI